MMAQFIVKARLSLDANIIEMTISIIARRIRLDTSKGESILDQHRSTSHFDSRSSGEESHHKGVHGNIVKTVEFDFHDSAV